MLKPIENVGKEEDTPIGIAVIATEPSPTSPLPVPPPREVLKLIPNLMVWAIILLHSQGINITTQ